MTNPVTPDAAVEQDGWVPKSIWLASGCLILTGVAEIIFILIARSATVTHSGSTTVRPGFSPIGITVWVLLPWLFAVFLRLGRRWAQWGTCVLVLLGMVVQISDLSGAPHPQSNPVGDIVILSLVAGLVFSLLPSARLFVRTTAP